MNDTHEIGESLHLFWMPYLELGAFARYVWTT